MTHNNDSILREHIEMVKAIKETGLELFVMNQCEDSGG